jgi:hypothetical protein
MFDTYLMYSASEAFKSVPSIYSFKIDEKAAAFAVLCISYDVRPLINYYCR